MSDTRPRPSLIAQVLAGVAIPFLLATALIGLVAYFSARDEISEVYDSQMITSAHQLWRLAKSRDDFQGFKLEDQDLGLSVEDQQALDEYAHWRTFRVWKSGKLIIASENAPAMDVAATGGGFHQAEDQTGNWRVFTLSVPKDDITVEVRERLKARREVSERIVWGLSLPLLIVTPIIILAVWLGVRWGLRDLRRFASDVSTRTPNDLSRLSGAVPSELAPLSASLNSLLRQLETSLAQERLFTDNAAHELRTPLAALGLQVDVARAATRPEERDAMLADLSKSVTRTSRLLDQLLTLARLPHTPADTQTLNLHHMIGEVIGDLYPNLKARRVEISLNGPKDIQVTSRASLLRLLLSNVIDNAIKFSPEGGEVAVSLSRNNGDAVITIRDHGPGIPEDERERVFGRFYRVRGTTAPGSGLGLSIVRVICDTLGVHLRLFTPADTVGLGVELRLPRACRP